jgi:hypothetical protein
MPYWLKKSLTEEEKVFCDSVADLIAGVGKDNEKSISVTASSWKELKRLEHMARAVAQRLESYIHVSKDPEKNTMTITTVRRKRFAFTVSENEGS